MYILDRNGNRNRAMSGLLDTPRTGMTPASVPNATFVGTTSASGGSTGSFPTAAVVVGVLAIGGYFLYKKMRE